MRFWILGLMATVALANPPSLTPEQHAWVTGWVNQLNPSPQQHQAVWDEFSALLLDGVVVLPESPLDPTAPMMSEAGCDAFLPTIVSKSEQCNDVKKAGDRCIAGVADPTQALVVCDAGINPYLQCKSDLSDIRADYREGCKGKYPPKH